MAKLDKEELKRLTPEERIARLKKLEEEHKEDLKEAEKLISESIDELEVRRAFTDEEPEIPRRPPEESELERTIREEPVKEVSIEQNVQYAIGQYNELSEMAEDARSGQYFSLARAEEIYKRLIQSETYLGKESQAVKEMAQASRRLFNEILGNYAAKQDYRPDSSVQ